MHSIPRVVYDIVYNSYHPTMDKDKVEVPAATLVAGKVTWLTRYLFSNSKFPPYSTVKIIGF